MTKRRFWLMWLTGMGTAAGLLAAPQPPADTAAPMGLQAKDIDVEACTVFQDGKEAQGDFRAGILATLGIGAGEPWSAGRNDEGNNRQYLLVLKQPVKIGSLLFQGSGTLKYWKSDLTIPPDAGKTNGWVDITFPPNQSGWRLVTLGVTTRAFLCTVERSWGDWHRFSVLRLLGPRFHNIVPEGIANGEAEYTEYHPLGPPTFFRAANIVNGAGRWQSHGPNQDGRIARAPVTDIAPTWFVVSWDETRDVAAILIQSNFRKFKLYSYQGPTGVNPAVAGSADWQRVAFTARAEAGGQWLNLPALKTRGLRFLVEGTDSQFGSVDGLQVYTDLHDAAVPARRVTDNDPPFKIPLELAEDAIVSMAIDNKTGARVRNLPARTDMKAGRYTIPWDMKDETGAFVAPGSYRWKAITHPGLRLKYEMTPYPNVETVTSENSPWLNGQAGSGGWLADHTPPRAVCAAGPDRVYLGAPCCESGVALIECDLQGGKHWGHGNMIAWTGPSYLASDGDAVYAAPWAGDPDYVWKLSLPGQKLDTLLQIPATAMRRRGIRGMAARDGRLYLSINAGEDWLENAASAADVDPDHCGPQYGKPPKTNKYDDPDYRSDFLRAFRLTGTPPGCKGLIYLETAKEPAARQHIVLAFDKDVPIGSFVFPLPEEKDLQMHISVLKPGAAYPPAAGREADWIRLYKSTGSGWTVVPAPEHTVARAVRLSFDKGLDELDEVLIGDEGGEPGTMTAQRGGTGAWKAHLEGMKILRRRFANLFPSCKVSVNSGTVTSEGEWDAKRTQPLTPDHPGIYMMEWETPQPIRGLAIKEVDGRYTEIDAWTGNGAPDMNASAGWEKLATYEQKTRYYYNPDQNHNSLARYLDGYVDFGREVKTRAIRMRVTEQWMWKDEDRGGCVGVRRDRGGEALDPTRCRIYGVAPLQSLGGEPAVDILATQRIEVYDLATRKLVKEIPLPKGGDLAFAPDGALWAVSGAEVVKVDLEGGKHTASTLDVEQPTAITFNKAGELFVYDSAPGQRVVRIFSPSTVSGQAPAGKALRTIGTPGGRMPGPYNPTRFTSGPGVAVDLAVDGKDQLWVVECDSAPKRVSLWDADGTFKKDLLGNTPYGGGGCLDRYDKSRLFYQGFEFALDWKSRTTSLKNVLWQGNAPPGEQPIQYRNRTYLVTRPLFAQQPVGIVYLYEKDHLKCVAAVGQAGKFPMLRTPAILEKLGKKAIGNLAFMWSDRNGDGSPQPDETEFFETTGRAEACGKFDETLGIDEPSHRYEVSEVLANGTPVYERRKKAFYGNALRMDNGHFFVVGNDEHMAEIASDGKTVWTHPAEGWGVHALYRARPWFPGQVVAQFGVIGHETATEGELGEFFVTHGNSGIWHIWTADGLLAGQLFRDMRGPGARPWSMPEHQRGLDLTGVTVGQEHFNGYFCRTREDGKFYAVAGHNHISVVEVQGFEKFRRLGGDLQVTRNDVAAAMEWDRRAQSRRLYNAAKLIECHRGSVSIDGDPSEWDSESARLADRDVSFAMKYDDANLYLCFQGQGVGPMKNAGNDWHRLFKTGAAVDLQIGTDSKADPGRQSPVDGDTRLLIAMVGNKPVVVRYQPVAPGATPEEAWETHTGVFQSSFDRVVKLTDPVVVARGDADRYCVEALIPLKTLGLKIQPDICYKMDWGILISGPDGTEVMQRLYWANQQTGIVSDEAAESQLHPDLWGTVRFSAGAGRKDRPEMNMDGTLEDDPGTTSELDAD